jgi:thiol:disulfide interchange protein DsbG
MKKHVWKIAPLAMGLALHALPVQAASPARASTTGVVPPPAKAAPMFARNDVENSRRQEMAQSILGKLSLGGDMGVIHQQFDGPAGMKGYVVGSTDDTAPRVIVWQTVDGKHLLVGNVLDDHGRDLTQVAGEHYNAENPVTVAIRTAVEQVRGQQGNETPSEPQINADKALAAVKALPKENRFVEPEKGDWTATLYMYFDPQCPYCHKLHAEMARYQWAEAGVRIEFLPVAVLEGDSERRAALVLDPAHAGSAHAIFAGQDVSGEPRPELIERVKTNVEAMKQGLVPATPAVVMEVNGSHTRAWLGLEVGDMLAELDVYGIKPVKIGW